MNRVHRVVKNLRVLPNLPHVADKLFEGAVLVVVDLLLDLKDRHRARHVSEVIRGPVELRIDRPKEVRGVFNAHHLVDDVLANLSEFASLDLPVLEHFGPRPFVGTSGAERTVVE